MGKFGALFLLKRIFTNFHKKLKPIWSPIVLKVLAKMGENSDQFGTNVANQKYQFGALIT